ncbi:hypothetical protein BDV33DRAFT_200475 [Aspergillus novoparasiticus]|uniref:Uncharacterized protein n=1 Tax=Aspergillus novoparasiticus TaxID=986946 RepID=A0A5N6F1Y3_9EURO|nr:hypothetical protein BDV33DRAFT_200475 [Aspergillus novoparasiticus]
MKFSKILSIVLATLSVGVSARPTTLSNDVQHVPADIRDKPFEVPVDIEKRAGHEETERFKDTQNGEVVKVSVGNKYELDFKGGLYHLNAKLEGSGQKAWYKTWVESVPWDPRPTTKTVKALHLKEISGKWEEKAAHASTAASEVSTKNGNRWQGKRNDCAEYVKAFEKAL